MIDIIKVKNLIKDKFKTQKMCAKKMEMDESQLSKYMTGEHQPSFPILDRLATALEVPVEELLLETKIGQHLNDAVNAQHRVIIAIRQGAMEIFNKEYEKYKGEQEGVVGGDTDAFFAVLTKLADLVGEHGLPTAEMLMDVDQPPPEQSGETESPPLKEAFGGKLQSRGETV